MTEWMIIALLASGSVCWAVGGSGPKWVRRFLLPAIYVLIVAISGVSLIKCAMLGALSVAALCFPYGDGSGWLIRIPVFMALCLPALAINIHAWPVVLVASVLITGLFVASRTWNWFTQKIVEFFVGAIQAGVIVVACLWK